MAGAFKILSVFLIGIIFGFSPLAEIFRTADVGTYALHTLIFLIGVTLGGEAKFFESFRLVDRKALLIPLAIVAGSLLGASAAGIFLKSIGISGALAAGSGLGFYSASATVAAKLGGASVGTLTLLANIFREIATFIFAPVLRRRFGPLSIIASGGATAMDTTLGVIIRSAGKEYAPLALISGFVLTLAVPLLIGLILG